MIVSVSSLIFFSFLGYCTSDLSLSGVQPDQRWYNNDWIVNKRASCSGDIGQVQNILIEVTDTDMIVSYSAPAGFEGCNLDYEVTYWNGVNSAIYQQTMNKNLRQSYNYWEGRALCKLVNLSITPIYNGVRGKSYESNQFTDKFDRHIDIGPPRNVSLTLTDVLHVKWISPIDYDSCPIYFTIETRDMAGVTLNKDSFQGFEWKYDYAADGNYCKTVVVMVESFMRGNSGGIELAIINLGPPPSSTC